MEEQNPLVLPKVDYLTGLGELRTSVSEFVGRALELQHSENFIKVTTELPSGSEKKITIDNGRATSSIRVYRKNIRDDSPLVFEETPLRIEGQKTDEILYTYYFVDPENVADFKIVRHLDDGIADGRVDFDSMSIPAIPGLKDIKGHIQKLALAEIHLGYIQKFADLAAAQIPDQA